MIGLLTACGGPANTPPPNQANNPPTVTLNSTTQSGTVPLTVTFTATGTPAAGETLSYSWNFGDGNTAISGPTQTHTFHGTGTFTTTVTASGVNGSAQASSAIHVTPAPELDPASPYDGRAHLGEWVWVAVTLGGREDYGTVKYMTYDGALNSETREMISGTWTDCDSSGCIAFPLARMGEVHISTGWEHSFAFYGNTGTIRVLGFELEPYITSDGSIGYSGLAESWGSAAGIAIAPMGPTALSTLSAGFDTLALKHPDAGWSAPEGLTSAFERLRSEITD